MSLEELRTELWRLPADERCAMLILSVTELDQDALAAPLNLIGVAEKKWVSASHHTIAAYWPGICAWLRTGSSKIVSRAKRLKRTAMCGGSLALAVDAAAKFGL